jgi:4-hydroxy-tetrahydrodipicolinate synthase
MTLMAGGFSRLSPKPAFADNLNNTPVQPKKKWAEKHLQGGESFILPSLKPDLKTLDEEGVRRDVRHAVSQGFCSIMPLPIGIDKKNIRTMYETVSDEAKGKIFTVGLIQPGKWEEMARRVRYMESLGFSHAMMYFNSKLPNEKAIYEQMRSVIDKTSLGIVLYARPVDAVKRMNPTGLPLNAFDQAANLDNVIGVKFTQTLRPATAYALAECLGDRLLLGVIDLELMLPLSLKYKMQWTGQWSIDCLQSPEQPWVNQFLKLLSEGKNKEAYKLYWRYEPIASAFYALQAPSLKIGGHPWMHIKYMKWLTGGNGGLLSDLKLSAEQVPHLNAEGRTKCREIFKRVGIKTVDLPDEAFVVGNAAYESGLRLKDMHAMPQYSL